VGGFARDGGEQFGPQPLRGDPQRPPLALLAEAGEKIEEVGEIGADLCSAGHQPHVGVVKRGAGVVVAGAEVDIAPNLHPPLGVMLAADDQQRLGVRLEARHPVDHVHPRPLKFARPTDVVLLIETGLQLDQRRDQLPVPSRARQGRHHRGSRPRAVEGLFDGEDVGVVGSLLEEPLHPLEGVKGVVEEDVPGLDGGEDRRMAAQLAGEAGVPGGIAEFGNRQLRELHEVADVEVVGDAVDILRL